MLNLSQQRNKDKIITLFIDEVSKLFPKCSFKYGNSKRLKHSVIEIRTTKRKYGYIRIENFSLLDDNEQGLIRKAVLVLAVIIEKLEFEKQLSNRLEKIDNLAKSRLIDLEEKIEELKDVRTASLNLIEDLSKEIENRKVVERALKESEVRFKTIVQNSDAVFFNIDKDGIFTLSEGRGLKILGLEPGQVVGQSAYEIYKDFPNVINQVKTCLNGSEVNDIVNLNGTFLEVFYNPQINERNEVIGLIGIAFDITNRTKQEENIRVLSQAVHQSPVSIVISDIEGKIEYVNPKFCRISGYSFEESIGKKTNILKSGQISEDTYRVLWDTILSGQEWNGIFINKKKTGELFWESANISPIKNDKNEITHFVAVKEDITEKVKAEKELDKYRHDLEGLVKERTEQLDAQYNFLRTLIDTIPNPVFVKNINGEFTDINKAFEEYYEIGKDRVIGNSIDVIASEDDIVKQTKEIDEKLLAKSGQAVYETYHINKHDEKRNLMVYKATFGLHKNKPEGVAGLLIDITEQKKLEEKTREALEKEKELNEIKTNFITTASHEFRTPLTSILASADLLEMFGRKWDRDKYLKYVNKIQRSVKEMTLLLDEILTLSRADRGELFFNPKMINLKRFVLELIEQLHTQKKEGQTIDLHYNTDQKNFVLDERLLKHILQNLITNSMKYSGENKNILVEISQIKEYIKLIIKDEGIGIPEKDLPRLFEPFYRASNSIEYSGSGLGLSIVNKSIELFKGSIDVESQLDVGTKTTIRIPIRNEENSGS
jgi:PAS domain S-box-containing protein